MNIARERKTIEATLDEYRAQLDLIPDDKFTQTPPGGGWSYAEVYSHILQATLGSSIAMERCCNNTCVPTTQKLTFLGMLMMTINRFPPVRVKVPEKVNAKMPALKISKEEARNLLIKCRKRIDEIIPKIEDALPTSRHKHPRLGMLNAGQWLKFIRIHLIHHLKQMDRIGKKLKKE
jgi:hypothetical protein